MSKQVKLSAFPRKRHPVIAGAGGDSGGSSSSAAVEDKDSLQSRAMVSLLDLLGEGEIGGLVSGAQSIFLNDTPLQNIDGTFNFNGFTWNARTGSQGQDAISGFSDIETPFVVTTKAKKDYPVTVTVSNPNVDQVRAIVSFPSLTSSDPATGDMHGATVQYKFSVSTDGGPFQDVIADTAYVAGGSWSYEAGVLTASRAADTLGLAAGVSISGDGGAITVQPEYWAAGVWNALGAVKTLDAAASSNLANRGRANAAISSFFVTAPAGAEKIRFRALSVVPVTLDGDYGPYAGQPPVIVSGAVNSLVFSIIATASGKTRSKYQRAHLLTLPKTGTNWSIRLTRITADSTTVNLADDTYFDSFVEIVNTRMNYPNSALVGLTIDSAQFSSIPTRSYMVDGLYIKVPSNYDAATRAYTGSWDGTFKVAVSGNPAWVLYDLLTSPRYGLGQFMQPQQVDKAKLYQIGRYCDGLVSNGFGAMEPRFVCNTVIAAQADAYKLISDLTSIFRGMGFWNGGMVGFTQDAPTDTSMVFNQANVIDGVFTYTGASRKDRHSVALITWNDPEQNYKQAIEYVEDAELVQKWGVRKIDMVAVGCTSRGQANRVGRWILYTEKYESEFVTFKVGLDAASVLPGEIVAIHDSFRAGKRMGGRLTAVTLNSAALDAPISIGGTSATISIRLPDGTFADRVIYEGVGDHNVVTWGAALPALPVDNAIWLMAESDLQPMLARVVSISQDNTTTSQFSITALAHNPTKYDAIEKGLVLELPKTSIIDPNAVDTPTNLDATEAAYLVAPSVMGDKLLVSWSGNASRYELKWRRTGKYPTNWATISATSVSADFENVQQGTYEFSLVGINLFGRRSPPVTLSHAITGHTTAPGDVLNFTARRRQADIFLFWDAVRDIKVTGYEVRFGASWDSGVVLTTKFSGTSLSHDLHEVGTYFYHVRSINSSDQYSDNVSTAVLEIVAPLAVEEFVCVQSGARLELRWAANTEANIVGYEVREGMAWSSSQLVATQLSTALSLPAGAGGNRIFWIKAIVAPGVPSAVPVFTESAVAQSSSSNVVFTDDERAAGFPGVKHFLTKINSSLQMDANAQHSEYLFNVHLPTSFLAQNSLFSTADSITNDTLTWAQANFSWASIDAKRQWTNSGSLRSISTRYQIAAKRGLQPGEVDGWRLDDSVASVNAVQPSVSTGVTYAQGRYGNGVLVTDMTTAEWPVAVPAHFSTLFWVIPSQVTDATFWSATGSAGFLTVGYSVRKGCFYLEGSDGQRVETPYAFAVNDRLCVGVVQTATARRLLVGRMGDTATSAEAAMTPIGALTAIRLY